MASTGTSSQKMIRMFLCLAATFALVLSMIGIAPQEAQAKSKKSSYIKIAVISKVTSKSDGRSEKTTYTYNSKGLVHKTNSMMSSGGAAGIEKQKYQYSGTKLKSITPLNGGFPVTASRNKKGFVTKCKSDAETYVISYAISSDKKGNPIKCKGSVLDSKGKLMFNNPAYKLTYNKKNQCTSVKSGKITTKFKYDAKGSISEIKSSQDVIKYSNSYKGGKLVKQMANNGSNSITFAYKTIKVPKAYASAVKAQQKKIAQKDIDYGVDSLFFA